MSKPEMLEELWDKSLGNLGTGETTSGVKVASEGIQALLRNRGNHAADVNGKATSD